MADIPVTIRLSTDGSGRLVGTLQTTEREARKMGRGLDEAGRKARTSGDQVQRFGQRSERAGRRIGNMARNVLMLAGIGSAVLALQQGVRVLGDFEQSMAGVQAVTQATGGQFEALRGQARELGATTEFTASQAAEGMRFLGQAGFETNEILSALPDTLNLATAAGIDLASAADIASNILSAFRMEAEQTGRMADTLAATAANANTNVLQLGDAMRYVGPVAAAMNIQVEDAAAAVGVLSDAGIQGQAAGTGLRRVLSGLANPTREAEKALKGMGVSLDDVNPATHELTEVIDVLAQSGISAAEALTIFGQRGGPAILALVSQNERLQELTEEIRAAEGASQDMADTMRDTLQGDIKTLQSALQELILQVGERGATGALRGFVQMLTEMARWIPQNIPTLLGLATAIAGLLIARRVGPAIAGMAAQMRAGTVAATAQAAAVTTLRSALAFLGGPAGVAIMAATAIAAFGIASRTAQAEVEELRERVFSLTGQFDDLSRAQLRQALSDTQTAISDTADEIVTLEERLAALREEAEKPTAMGDRTGRGDLAGALIGDVEQELAVARERMEELTTIAADLGVSLSQVGGESAEAARLQQELEEAMAAALEAAGRETDATDELTDRLEEFTKQTEDALAAVRLEAVEFAGGAQAALDYQIAILAAQGASQEQLATIREKGMALIQEREALEAAREAQEASVRAEQRAQRQQERGRKSLDDYIESLWEEVEAVGMSREELEVLTAVRETERLLLEAGIDLTSDMARERLAEARAAVRQRQDAEEYHSRQQELYDEQADAAQQAYGIIADAWEGLMTGQIEDFDDFVDQILDQFMRMLTRMITEGQSQNIMGALFGGGQAGAQGGGAGQGAGGQGGMMGGFMMMAGAMGGSAAGGGGQGANIGATIGTAIGSIWGPIGGMIGGFIGGLAGGLFDDNSEPKFQVRGTEATRAIDEGTDEVVTTPLGEIEFAFRKIEAEAQRRIIEAFTQLDTQIAGVIRDQDQLAQIEQALAEWAVSSRSDGEDLEGLLQSRFDAILSTFDDFTQDFVARGVTLEEQMQRFEDMHRIGTEMDQQRGLGIVGDDAFERTLEIVDELRRSTETVGQAFARLRDTMVTLDAAAALTGNSIAETREEAIRFADELTRAFGDDLQRGGQLLSRIFQTFYSDAERAEVAAEHASQRARELLEGIGLDVTDDMLTESGFRELFDNLFGTLSPEDTALLIEAGAEIANLIDAEDALAASRRRQQEELSNLSNTLQDDIARFQGGDLVVEYRQLNRQLREHLDRIRELEGGEELLMLARQRHAAGLQALTVQAMSDLVSLRDELFGSGDAQRNVSRVRNAENALHQERLQQIEDLRRAIQAVSDWIEQALVGPLSPLTPQEQLDETQSQFWDAFNAAMSGDAQAASDLPALADAFLQQAASFFGTSTSDYQALFDQVMAAMQEVADMTVPDAPGQGNGPVAASQIDQLNQTAGDQLLAQLEQAQQAQQLMQLIGLLSTLRDLTPAEIAQQFGIPLDDLAEMLTGELPGLTGDALADYFNNLATEASEQADGLADLEVATGEHIAVSEEIRDIAGEQLSVNQAMRDLLADIASGDTQASFDVGTAHVSRDMTAQIHRGEKIIDPTSAAILERYGIRIHGAGDPDSGRQLAEIRRELAEIRSITEQANTDRREGFRSNRDGQQALVSEQSSLRREFARARLHSGKPRRKPALT